MAVVTGAPSGVVTSNGTTDAVCYGTTMLTHHLPHDATRTPSVATAIDAASPDAPNIPGTLILIIASTAPESPGGVPVTVSTGTAYGCRGVDGMLSMPGDSSNMEKVTLATSGTPSLAVTVPVPGMTA